MIKLAGAGICGRGNFHFFEKLFDTCGVAEIDEAVGIGHPEIYAVFRAQFVAQNFLAVHISTVTAAHILQDVNAFRVDDLRLLAADAAIAQRQFVAGLTANAKWRGGNGHFPAHSAGLDQCDSRGSRHLRMLRLCGCANCAPAGLKAPLMVGKDSWDVNSGADRMWRVWWLDALACGGGVR